ncbi:MAG TPA: hypothetical protein VJK51_03170 [Candidatus Nanoarchaeia archaeon]|nr:hypothetical protein [Candidatus Nanoarchaeia archaeon]
MNVRGYEFSFGWMFAIIAGAALVGIALYAGVRFISVGQEGTGSIEAAQLSVLFTPLGSSIEEGKLSFLELPKEDSIVLGCSSQGLGSTSFRVVQDDFGERVSGRTSSSLSYVASAVELKGKRFRALTKPILFPYKVGDMIILFEDSERYCFVDAPNELEEELVALNSSNLVVVSGASRCPAGSKSVCFGSAGCSIRVELAEGLVVKGRKSVPFDLRFGTGLLFAAIVSDPMIYTCQLERLMHRAGLLADLYIAKTNYLSTQGCSSGLASELELFSNELGEYSGGSLHSLASLAQSIERDHDALICTLY